MGTAIRKGKKVSWPHAHTSQEEGGGAIKRSQPKTHFSPEPGNRMDSCGITVAGTVSAIKASSDPSEEGEEMRE